MDVATCNCKDTKVIEGVFGEIYPELLSDKNWPTRLDEVYEDIFRSIPRGEENPIFGGPTPITIKSYTMTNNNRIEVVIITWGATIVSLKCPDKFGHPVDIVLGFDNIDSYIDPMLNPFIGCVLGRCANRIRDGCFSIKNKHYQLSTNDNNKHHLHGGTNGFGRRIWDSYIDGCTVVMSYLSNDGEEGYPGAVLVTIRFKLTSNNKLEINMRATTSKSTIVNMSHGSFFNLAGHGAGETELQKHKISLNCDRWTFADYTDPIPTGAIRGVGGTVMDLRVPKAMRDLLHKVPPGEGYDHNFCVLRSWQPGISFVAKALHPSTGRILEVYSDQPGVQFYTGGRLPPQTLSDPLPSYNSLQSKKWSETKEINNFEDDYGVEEEDEEEGGRERENEELSKPKRLEFISGKHGAQYRKHGAFSIQPQNYPNAINFQHFPCTILHPGQVYSHDLTYKFGIQLGNYM